jgi:Zn-dependent protease with chaperone function
MAIVEGERLHVSVGGQHLLVEPAGAHLRATGGHQQGLAIEWRDARGAWSAHALDAAQAAALQQSLPASFAQPQHQLTRQRRQSRRRNAAWLVLLVGVLALPLLGLGLFFLYADDVVDRVAAEVTLEQEVALGRQSWESMRGGLALVGEGPAVVAVRDLGARLTRNSSYSYEFHVVDSDEVNAFALPGGIIAVNTGLIKATARPEELAGVLAHEVQHVELRHGVKGVIKNLGWRVAWALLAGDTGALLGGDAAAMLGELAFSREAEREADARGHASLVREGIDPRGIAEFFSAQEQREVASLGWLSTHPGSEERAAALAELTRQSEGAVPRVVLDYGPWPPL